MRTMKSIYDIVGSLKLAESDFVDGLMLTEDTYKDLRRRAPDYLNIRDKSKDTPGSDYIGIEGDVVSFETPSHTDPGKKYTQTIKLLELFPLIKKYSGSKKSIVIVRMAIEGQIEVHCTDPSWKYWGFQHIGTRKNYAIEPEPRRPDVRNPNMQGSVCKHLDNVLYVLPFHASEITRDLRKQKRL